MKLYKRIAILALTAITLFTATNAFSQARTEVNCTLKGIYTNSIFSAATAKGFRECFWLPYEGCDPSYNGIYLGSGSRGVFTSVPGSNDTSPAISIFSDIRLDIPNTEDIITFVISTPETFFKPPLINNPVYLIDAANKISGEQDFSFSYANLLKEPYVTKINVPWYSYKQQKLITRRARVVCAR